MPPTAPVLDTEQPETETKIEPDTRPADTHDPEEPAILDELLVEEVDIDGMCGVY